MYRGFSLIELIVVIAIIGILAAVATPLYNQYKARVIVTAAYSDVASFAEQIKEYYEMNGTLPGYSEMSYAGVPMAWIFRVVNHSNLYHLAYDRDSDNNGFLLAGTVKGLSGLIPDYIEPETEWGHLSTIRYAARNVDGVWRTVCGVANVGAATPPSGTDVPLMYSPGNCDCTSVHDFAYGDDYSCINN